jgi:hypothetical protein
VALSLSVSASNLNFDVAAAVCYSISNGHKGIASFSLGSYLIKAAAQKVEVVMSALLRKKY